MPNSEFRTPLSPDAPVPAALTSGLWPALGFYALAAQGTALCAAWLWAHPATLLSASDPEALAWFGERFWLIAALPGLCGWAYQLTPLLGGVPWRWPALPWLHLALHFGGLVWIGATQAGPAPANPADAAASGGLLMLGGVVLLGVHHLATVSRRSWWEPANVLTGTALGWLFAAVALATLPGADRLVLHGVVDARGALALAATGAALSLLLAGVMRAATLLSGARRGLGAPGWIGWLVFNLGIIVSGAGAGSTAHAARVPGAWLLVAGAAFLALATLRAGAGGWRRAGPALALAVAGALVLPLVLAAVAASLPESSAEAAVWGSWWRESAVWVVTGPAFALVLGGLALFGRLFRPPARDGASIPAFAGPLMLAWALGAGYAAAALHTGEKTGLVLAAVCWLVAMVLLVFAAGSRAGLIPAQERSAVR